MGFYRNSLPTRIGEGVSAAQVFINESNFLVIQVQWPKILNDVTAMHRKWLTTDVNENMQPYHPRMLSYKSCLETLDTLADGNRTSTAKIVLPCNISETFSKSK